MATLVCSNENIYANSLDYPSLNLMMTTKVETRTPIASTTKGYKYKSVHKFEATIQRFHTRHIPRSHSWSLATPSSASLFPSKSFTLPRLTKIASISPSLETKTSAISPMPKLSIPPTIYSTTPGSYAYDTMSRRLDSEILERTWRDNKDDWTENTHDYPRIVQRFNELRQELRNAATSKLTYLDDLPRDATPTQIREQGEWENILKPFVEKGDTYLTAPWLVAEFYVYRRLMQAIGYFDKDSKGYLSDPFHKQKRAGLESSVASAEAMLSKIPNLPNNKEGLRVAASIALWGNKMDLSLWPADTSHSSEDVFSDILAQASENLLNDDTESLAKHCFSLKANGGGEVDIIVDNAGFELVTDLALAQYLIQSGIAKVVTFQLKFHPIIVSDAMEKDLLETIEYFQSLDLSQYPNAKAAGDLWKAFLESGQIKCSPHTFWVQPFPMWDMAGPLLSDMTTRCDLAFVKGDCNYRRLLGDRQWEYTNSFEDVVGAYFPCPVCALRTLKSELGCGMDADQIERARSSDPENWMLKGQFGVVQFGTGRR